jgi:hypothetical protein
MRWFCRRIRSRRNFISTLTLTIFIVYLVLIRRSFSNEFPLIPSHHSKWTRYEQFCQQVNQRIALEEPMNEPITYLSQQRTIPYGYSQWKSTSIMPRMLTPCEHAIFLHLLSVLIEHVFKKHNISYMMIAATLLGKFTLSTIRGNSKEKSG